MKYAAVISSHTNPYTCGVARFNKSLAETLATPIVTLNDYLTGPEKTICLLSLKMEEIEENQAVKLTRMLDCESPPPFDYFAHDVLASHVQNLLLRQAKKVFANSAEMASSLRELRTDVIAVYSPGAPVRAPRRKSDLKLLTAGMAHKIRGDGYAELARILVGDPRSISLEITSAIHEGQRFDESFFSIAGDIQEAFRHDVHFCGFLSDEELSQRLRECDAYVAFFPRGVRENNTSVLSAMTHGCPVITNLDHASPGWMIHNETVFDVGQTRRFPDRPELRRVGEAGRIAASVLSFERLASILVSPDE